MRRRAWGEGRHGWPRRQGPGEAGDHPPPRKQGCDPPAARAVAEEAAMTEKKAEKKRWVRGVKTVSTYPPEGLFTKDAEAIARAMASEKVSPKGIGSGIRMIQFFINRAGKNLPTERGGELEKAKRILPARAR